MHRASRDCRHETPRPDDVLAALSLAASPANEAQPALECDPALMAQAPPEVPAWDSEAPFVTIYDGAEARETVPLGIGRIGRISAFWWGSAHVRLPLHERPGAAPWGWFADGWLRLRYDRPSETRDGTAWVHRCHLARESLAFESWRDRFLSEEISPLYLRDGAPGPLRAGPSDDAEELARIDGDYHLEPLGYQGDWMRVRLTTPSDYCAAPGEVRTTEGWIRWRSAERGPLVWYYTRGC